MIGRTSSRARTAPYAAAARTPSTVSVGYSARMSCSAMPAARQSSTTLTGTRVPVMQAWPWTMAGPAVIRRKRSSVLTIISFQLSARALLDVTGSSRLLQQLAQLRPETWDPETDFVYLQARYYDPSTAEFLTGDPAFALTGSRYGYA